MDWAGPCGFGFVEERVLDGGGGFFDLHGGDGVVGGGLCLRLGGGFCLWLGGGFGLGPGGGFGLQRRCGEYARSADQEEESRGLHFD